MSIGIENFKISCTHGKWGGKVVPCPQECTDTGIRNIPFESHNLFQEDMGLNVLVVILIEM